MKHKKKGKRGPKKGHIFDDDAERVEFQIKKEELEIIDRLTIGTGQTRAKFIREALEHYLVCERAHVGTQTAEVSILKQPDREDALITARDIFNLAEEIVSDAWVKGLLENKQIRFKGSNESYPSVKEFLSRTQMYLSMDGKTYGGNNIFKGTGYTIEEFHNHHMLNLKKYIEAEKEALHNHMKYHRLLKLVNDFIDPEPSKKIIGY